MCRRALSHFSNFKAHAVSEREVDSRDQGLLRKQWQALLHCDIVQAGNAACSDSIQLWGIIISHEFSLLHGGPAMYPVVDVKANT